MEPGTNRGSSKPSREDHTSRKQNRYQRETARKTSDGSSLRSAGNDPLVKRGKEAEIQASEPMDVEAGRDEPSLVIKDHGKEALHHAAQEEAETADKDRTARKRDRNNLEVTRRGGPPECRGEPETWAHVYRGSSGTRPRIAYVEKEKSTEGSQKRSRSPHGRQAEDRPHGTATQGPSRQAKPVAAPEEGVGSGCPSSSEEEEAPPAKAPRAQATMACSNCNKECSSLKALNNH